MSGRTYSIKASDGRFWSGVFTTIPGTSIKTMQLLSSAKETFQTPVDGSGWYQQIVIQPANKYLQWSFTGGHVALTQSAQGPGGDQENEGVAPPVPTPLTFKVWGNVRSDYRNTIIISTSEGQYLTRTQGTGGIVYIDGTDKITPDCIFTLVS